MIRLAELSIRRPKLALALSGVFAAIFVAIGLGVSDLPLTWPVAAEAMPGLEVESLGGKGRFRKDKIAEQVFYQGPSTNNNKYDFPTLASVDTFRADQLQKPPGTDFWKWIETAQIKL